MHVRACALLVFSEFGNVNTHRGRTQPIDSIRTFRKQYYSQVCPAEKRHFSISDLSRFAVQKGIDRRETSHSKAPHHLPPACYHLVSYATDSLEYMRETSLLQRRSDINLISRFQEIRQKSPPPQPPPRQRIYFRRKRASPKS